jgi:nitric oxide dioxygenase
MLPSESTEVVRVTLTADGAAIGDITIQFDRNVFAAHPSLERDLFNRGNQEEGEQQRALVDGIAAFAALKLDPDTDKAHTTLSRIANRYAPLGVTVDEHDMPYVHQKEHRDG